MSGPVGGRGRAAAAARATAAPRESVALGERALALVRGLPDHSLIDRLIRGRAWIPVLGVLLVGIVAMQVEILKLGSTMGRAVERTAALQTQNESLRAGVASLADDQRIERLAAGMGMTMPTPDSLVFLQARGGGIAKALGNIHTPDPTGFISALAAQAAAAAALMPPPPASTAPNSTAGAAAATGTGGLATSGGSTTTSTATSATTSPAATAPPATGPATTAPATTAPATTAPAAAAPAASASAPTGTAPASSGAAASGAAGIAPAGSVSSSGSSGG